MLKRKITRGTGPTSIESLSKQCIEEVRGTTSFFHRRERRTLEILKDVV